MSAARKIEHPPRDYRDISAEVLTQALKQHFLEDVARTWTRRDILQFTYFQRASHSRLGRIYVSAEAISSTTDYSVTPLFFADHCLVSVTLGKTKPRRNRFNWQPWKINNTLLKDDDFDKAVLEIIKRVIATKESCYLEKWEYIKEEVKPAAIERSSHLKREAPHEEKELQRYWQELFNIENANPGAMEGEIKQVRSKLDGFHQERYQGAVVRARAERFLLGEHPTRRDLDEEKKYAITKEISAIYHDGVASCDKDFIKRAFLGYFF